MDDSPAQILNPSASREHWAWLGLSSSIFCAAGAVFSGLGYRWGFWDFPTGFMILRGTAVLSAIAALCSLAALGINLGRHKRGVMVAAIGFGVGLTTTIVPVQWQHTLNRLPRINDITTDTEDPPQFVVISLLHRPTDRPLTYSAAENALKQKAAYPDLRPIHTRAGEERTFEAAKEVIAEMKLKLVSASLKEGRLEAVHTSVLFGFKDDMVVRIRKTEPGTRVDVRSKSRVGRSDLGQNAKRIRLFNKAMRAKLPE